MTDIVELEIRGKDHGTKVVDVSFPKRIIDLVVIPYEQEANVDYHGRWITEVVSRGAFGNIQRRGDSRVKVNMNHDTGTVVGKVTAFHPDRQEGLVAEVKVSRNEYGTELLRDAEDGLYDASAGFSLKRKNGTMVAEDDAQVWETTTRRRLYKLWLHHIALTPDPAYDGAQVLAVRQNGLHGLTEASGRTAGTPNLDVVRGWLVEDRLTRLQSGRPSG